MSNSPNNVSLTVTPAYTYSYSGGNQGNGNVTFKKGGGQAAVTVSLTAPDGFKCVSVDFSGQGSDDFNYQITGNGKGVVIIDKCNEIADVKYTVNVVESSTGTNVACDPQIKNVP